MIHVDDPDDSRLALFHRNERGLASRADRRDDDGKGMFMAEGDLVVERALAAGCVPVAALVDGDNPPPVVTRLGDVPVYVGGDRLRAHVTGLGIPQTIVAVFMRPRRATVDDVTRTARRVVLVEAVDNPVNVGGIVRNAAGLGWNALILDGTSADPLSRRSLRVSMGHAVSFPYARQRLMTDVIGVLRAADFVVVALTPADNAVDIATIDSTAHDRLAVVIGSERVGLGDDTLGAATMRARIPMADGVDSLNAAAASAVACYALG